jgi:Na+-transporting NADH:ubiquinone oxidoreductase subunit C
MLGFMALAPDANTIKGFAYYKHGETPGLGGEVDNPKWKASWIGKKIFSDSGDVEMKVVKGIGQGNHEVDGLSGATITCNGISSSMKYWFGSHGYGKLLETIKAGGL